MNKAKFYPLIFAVVFGIVGIIICPLMGNLYHSLAKDVKWSDRNEASLIFIALGLISYFIFFTIIVAITEFALLYLLAPGFLIILIELSTDGCSLATGVIFSSLIGAISGEIVEAIVHKDHTSTVICWIFGAIIGGIFYNNGFIVSLPIVPAFASIGYAIGVPIKERAEIKRREELERERIRREEERRRKEYERIMKECKLKLKQWKEEGYDVSELEEMLK